MALTYAHSDGRDEFELARHRRGDDDDRVGHRADVDYVPEDEPRAVAIHEAGHAVASHVYMTTSISRACRSASAAARSATTR